MPIICVFVPSYKVEIARLTRPELLEVPVLVADRLDRGRVIDLDARAHALGARAGMTLLQAAAYAREASTVVDEPARNHAVWEVVLEVLDAGSPLVEDAAEGTAFLDMRGILGTPRRWLNTLRDALSATVSEGEAWLPFTFGLARNKFVSRAAARVAAHAHTPSRIVRSGEETAFLAPLSLEVLEVDDATRQRLRLLGVRTLGELAALPHGPFVRRFGPTAARWHACARGIDERPLIPRPRALRIDHTLFGEGTAEHEEQVLFALRTLVARVAEDVALAGKRCGMLHLVLECEDAQTHELLTVLAQPTSAASTMFDLLRARLEGVTLGSPVAGLRLGAQRLEEGGSERSLFAGDDPDPETVGIALARLTAAFGEGCTLRACLAAGNRPETCFCYEPFCAGGLGKQRVPRRPPVLPERPATTLRLVEPRELEVVTRGGLPYRIGSPPQTVAASAGPWRVDEAWWDEALGTAESHCVQRDEFDVLLESGALLRIARDGTRWTLRGTYD